MRVIRENMVRAVRRQKGITIRQLHEATGISPSYIYYIETNRKVPSIYHAQKLARALDTTVDILFPYDNDNDN
ncbi:MAG TPA: helix-turn-helix transcriptional regulator [Firmicutes bacterium]|nr:helix-turn-helix transcriptional regulator [Bacillota bacterium]